MTSALKQLDAKRKPTKPQSRVPPIAEGAQRTCIDLPGETIRCYLYRSKLEVMLRKHRDVIFEFHLFKGLQYTVQADQGDFYNARDKKLEEFKFRHRVSFADGERLHLWVSREFKGDLIVKANGKLVGRFAPNRLDPTDYGEDPASKPAPLVVVMQNEGTVPCPAPAKSKTPLLGDLDVSLPKTELLVQRVAPKPVEEMHIVEAKPGTGTEPEEVANFFKLGGEDTAIDASKLMTRNWLWAQIAGAAAYAGDNWHWVRELWRQKFRLTKVKGKTYIVFKGVPGLREYLTGTRYLTDTPKVIAISAGVGSIQGVNKAAWEAVKGSIKGAAKFALVLTIALDFAEWLADYEQRDPKTGKPKRDFYDLGAKIFTDVAWAVLAAAIGTALVAVFTSLAAVALGVVVVGGAVVVGSIAAAIAVGLGLAWLDSQLGITPGLAASGRRVGEHLANKLPTDYSNYGQSVENMIAGGAP